ncbi:hypothetical protein M6D93_03645 [Jatrophihabitans telluris]|uniref:Uncharacterized protein n=1 Tax=Jatrophihabitans telluris TaxID=2038343 RepID=A0ABY4R0R1_9ACTN|nr:hypothetical protein [Jatrophihabitans telluris]UQX89102.1 hypothetical protein M6D93_03645 [Jatrophihabitans telluris]
MAVQPADFNRDTAVSVNAVVLVLSRTSTAGRVGPVFVGEVDGFGVTDLLTDGLTEADELDDGLRVFSPVAEFVGTVLARTADRPFGWPRATKASTASGTATNSANTPMANSIFRRRGEGGAVCDM